MNYNQEAALRSLRGAQNRVKGKVFEEYIEKACQNYSDKGIAAIEKTPEPFHVTESKGNGKFEGHFEKPAQPDYKGTLRGGQSICFDAKATDTDRILLSALSEKQAEALAEHALLGGVTGVLVTFSFKSFAFIPFGTFIRARALNGHKYWNEKDCEPYMVFIRDGYLDFLDNQVDMRSGNNGIYHGRNFCASCKYWGESEPYLDNDEREVSYPICTNKAALDCYGDYKPSDCYACDLYESEEK